MLLSVLAGLALFPVSSVSQTTLQDSAPAQVAASRYTVGQRMIRMEQAWMSATPAQRDAAVPRVTAAVTQFFGGRLADAAQQLDEATALLRGRGVSPFDALDLRVDPAVRSPQTPAKVRGTWTYLPASKDPVEVKVDGQTVAAIPGVPFELELKGEPSPSGDRTLTALAGNLERAVLYSVLPQWESRRQRILAAGPEPARDLIRLIDRAGATATENDVRAAHALDLAERLEKGTPLRQLGELPWATFKGALLRAEWPVPLPPAPVLVIAVHGAGGSENLFFEGYGAGLAPHLAEQRGWVFVAPRSGPSAPSLALEWARSQLGIQPRAIFLIGHSMGGAMALRSTEPPLAMALFAPAATTVPEPLRAIPTLLAVGTGEIPFLRNSAQRLKEQLTSPQSELVTLPHAEHLMVVAEGLPAAYRFFDQVLEASGRTTPGR